MFFMSLIPSPFAFRRIKHHKFKAMNYLIVDDEPLAHRVIEKFATTFSWLQKIGNAYDAFEGFELINTEKVDLIFLDINMPKLKGLDFLRTLANPPYCHHYFRLPRICPRRV